MYEEIEEGRLIRYCSGRGNCSDNFYLFYDNGNKDDNLYNQVNQIVSRGTVTNDIKAYKTLKYNRILPVKDIDNLSILQALDNTPIFENCSTDEEVLNKFKLYNFYTIYRVEDSDSKLTYKTYHYYMFDMDKRLWGKFRYAYPYYVLREVTAPSLGGIKYKDTDE